MTSISHPAPGCPTSRRLRPETDYRTFTARVEDFRNEMRDEHHWC